MVEPLLHRAAPLSWLPSKSTRATTSKKFDAQTHGHTTPLAGEPFGNLVFLTTIGIIVLANLIDFNFTEESDFANSTDGWLVGNGDIIETLSGNDTITGAEGGFAILNIGTIDTGIDTLKGFGQGTFIGGVGTDKIIFGDGIYVIKNELIGGTMLVSSFEKIGGVNGGLFTFANGTLTVTNGIGTFV